MHMILYCLQQRHDLDFLRVEKVSEAGGVPAPHEEQRLLLKILFLSYTKISLLKI